VIKLSLLARLRPFLKLPSAAKVPIFVRLPSLADVSDRRSMAFRAACGGWSCPGSLLVLSRDPLLCLPPCDTNVLRGVATLNCRYRLDVLSGVLFKMRTTTASLQLTVYYSPVVLRLLPWQPPTTVVASRNIANIAQHK